MTVCSFDGQTIKRSSLVLVIMLSVCFKNAEASDQLSYGSPAFLGGTFTGNGQMNLSLALKKIVPQDVKVLFMDVDPNQMTRMNYSKAFVFNILNDFSKTYHFNWELVENKLIIMDRPAQAPDGGTRTPSVDVLPTQDEQYLTGAQSIKPGEPTSMKLPIQEVEGTQPQQFFDVRIEDETLSLAIRRWSIESGYQLVWDTDKDFTAIKTSYNGLNYLDAVGNVMRDTGKTDYPMHSCIYTNRVLRVLPLTSPCERISDREGAHDN